MKLQLAESAPHGAVQVLPNGSLRTCVIQLPAADYDVIDAFPRDARAKLAWVKLRVHYEAHAAYVAVRLAQHAHVLKPDTALERSILGAYT